MYQLEKLKSTLTSHFNSCGNIFINIKNMKYICSGTFTGIAGSGVDICSFSILTLLFRL